MLVERHLHEHGDRSVVEPSFMGREHARPRPAAAALDLAPLHGQSDVVAAGIAANDLELGAEDAVEDARKLIGIGGLPRAADDQLVLEHICKLADTARFPRDADAHLIVGAADPGELVGLELCAARAQQGIECGATADGPDDGAVLRPDIVEPVGEPQTPCTLQVLGDDGRIARDVLAKVTCKHPGIKIIGAAYAISDVELDILAFVEFRRPLCASGQRRQQGNEGGNSAGPATNRHYFGSGAKPGAGST